MQRERPGARRRAHAMIDAARAVLKDTDPLGLIALGAPSDEYDPVADELAPDLARMGPDPDALAGVVRRALERRFGAGTAHHEACAQVAARLAVHGYRLALQEGPGIPSGSLHYYDWAIARRPALLCLHGMANCGLGFAELAARLGGHYRVIAPDLPGHGETPPFRDPAMYRFSRLAAWLDAVIGELVDEPIYLLGHSWGAAIALHCAARYPERVRGLILLDGGLDQPADVMPLERALELWASYIESARFPGWEEAVASMRGYTRRWSPLLEQAARAMFRPRGERLELIMERATAEAILRAFYEEPFSPLYGAVRARILCLCGGDYPAELQPARREALAALHRQAAARVNEIAGAGHLVHWDEPDRVAAAIHAAIQGFFDPSPDV